MLVEFLLIFQADKRIVFCYDFRASLKNDHINWRFFIAVILYISAVQSASVLCVVQSASVLCVVQSASVLFVVQSASVFCVVQSANVLLVKREISTQFEQTFIMRLVNVFPCFMGNYLRFQTFESYQKRPIFLFHV